MKRLVLALILILIVSVHAGEPAGKTIPEKKILVIASERGEPYQRILDACVAELARQGYKLGEQYSLKYYSLDHFPGLAKRFLKLEKDVDYDVILVLGTVGTIAVKDLIFGDPKYKAVVFTAVTDPVGVGVVDNFTDPPKKNFTGVAYPVPVRDRFMFLKRMMPKARKVGLIYSDMPQSLSYKKWVENLLAKDPDFKDYEVLFRKVPFVMSKGGRIRMTMESEKFVRELNPKVDVFMSPNDQLATHKYFPRLIAEIGEKPLIGLAKIDVMEKRGATMALFPTGEGSGRQTAGMVKRLFDGTPIKDIIPEKPKYFGVAFDMRMIKKYGIKIPPDLLKQAGKNIIPITEEPVLTTP